jgi:hypothetical protein
VELLLEGEFVALVVLEKSLEGVEGVEGVVGIGIAL